MATSLKNLSDYDPDAVPGAEGMKVGIVVTDYHNEITNELLKGCTETLLAHGVSPDDVSITHVPGAYELPLGARLHYQQNHPDAVICLGCVITGETRHDEYINQAVAGGIMQLGLALGVPFIFGVLTPGTRQQALDRAGGKHGNKGTEAAITAIKMVAIKKANPKGSKKSIGFAGF